MSLVELVQAWTADGVRLDGALAVSKSAGPERKPTVDAVLAIHGTGSNFYSGTLFEGLTPKLLADGTAVLRANTRGHDVISATATLAGPKRLGSSLEQVDDCRHDLAAWLEFLASRGYQSVALVGHSLGAIKAVYFAAYVAHPALKRLMAISPPRLSYSYYLESERRDEFEAHYRTAQEHIASRRGETLMEIRTPLPFLVSAASFVDKYGLEEKYNILRQIGRISVPALFAFGGVELEEVNFRGLPEAIGAAAKSGQNVRVVTIAGANHIYTGQIEELAHKLRAWLAGTG
jgi:pimeloyl-ACP methyl ester carboxylesterase